MLLSFFKGTELIVFFFRSRVYFGDYIRDRCRDETSNSYYSIPQMQNLTHQQSVATSTNDIEGNVSNNNGVNNLIITPPPPSQQPSNASLTLTSNQQQTNPSLIYRVVPTSYGNNSNTSTLSSILPRNDNVEGNGNLNSNGM